MALWLTLNQEVQTNQLAVALGVRRKRIDDEILGLQKKLENINSNELHGDQIGERWRLALYYPEINADQLNSWLTICKTQLEQKPSRSGLSTRSKEILFIVAIITVIISGVWLFTIFNPEADQNLVAQDQLYLSQDEILQKIAEPLEYTLLPGERLQDVAKRLNLTVDHILNMNHLSSIEELSPGQKILVNLALYEKKASSDDKPQQKTAEIQTQTAEPLFSKENYEFEDKVEKLTPSSNRDDFLARMQISQKLWTSLFVEGQWVDYGPENYLGGYRSQRFQAWIQQPGSSLLKIGSLESENAQEIHLITSGLHITNYPGREKQLAWWDGGGLPINPADPLRAVLSPFEFFQAIDQESLSSKGAGKTAGRSVISLEALSINHTRLYRLEVDAYSGILMKLQVFSMDGKICLAEIVLTQIQLDPNFEENNLFDPLRLENTAFSRDFRYPFPEGSRISNITKPAIISQPRTKEAFAPAPRGFDPSASQIVFQPTDSQQLQQSTTTQIISDGYQLSQIELPPYWQAACRRSKQGNVLAFYERKETRSQHTYGFLWLNLLDADKVYQAMSDFDVFDLAFHPDGRKMAVIARPINSIDTNIYLLDYVTEATNLCYVEQAGRLQWKPDGQYISILGKLPEAPDPAWMTVHVETGLLTYQSPIPPEPQFFDGANLLPYHLFPPAEFPAWQWDTSLTRIQNSLENCASPG